MDQLAAYIPESKGGYLPYWQLLVAITALANGLTSVVTPKSPRRLYDRANVTPAHSRAFGLWTITSGIVRLAAAYDISNRSLYMCTMGTYAIAWVHFVSEWLAYRTASLDASIAMPFLVSTSSFVWMWNEWSSYVA